MILQFIELHFDNQEILLNDELTYIKISNDFLDLSITPRHQKHGLSTIITFFHNDE